MDEQTRDDDMRDTQLTEHGIQISEIRERIRSHDEDIKRHEKHLAKLDETVGFLRQVLGSLATKTDILDLRKDISEQFNANMRDAHNSVPTKIAVIVAVGMFLLTFAAFFISHHA